MKSHIVFKKDGKKYRIVGLVRNEKEYGYEGFTKERYNVLQVKLTNFWDIITSFSFWKNVEEEHVPNHVAISVGALGFSDWRSELIKKYEKDINFNGVEV
jgi:hypothetical protein